MLWNRSATWAACGAPLATAAAYSPPRSRLTTRISGCCFIQAAALSWSRSGTRRDHAVADQVHQDRPEPVPALKREIVSSKLDDRACWKIRQHHDPPQDRLAGGWHAQPCAEPCRHPLPLEARPHGLQSRTQSHGHPGPWLGEGGHTLGKDVALALLSATKECAHREVQLDLAPTTGDIA